MAQMAWTCGTDRIIATPHFCRPDQPKLLSLAKYRRDVDLLQQDLQRQGCPLQLQAGMELFATEELSGLLERQEFLTLADSRYLLVEFFFDEDAGFMEESLQQIWEHGFTPIVAHPESYYAVQEEPDIAAAWFLQGCILQLNKGTVLGHMGVSAGRTAWRLLRQGLAHVVASDAHSAHRRNPDLSTVRDVIGQDLSWRYAEILLEENPYLIFQNERIVPTGSG